MAEERALQPYENQIYDMKVKKTFLEVTNEKTYLKEVIFAKQAFDASDSLQKCAPASIRNAIVNVALTGATLNPALQQAFLIPRKGKACLDFSYRGLTQIAISSGGVLDIDASVVYENDEFEYHLGLYPDLNHRPCMDGNRGNMEYVYAVAILPSQIRKFIVLDKKEIDAIKKSSVAFSKGSDTPWKGDFEAEMWRKTAVKKLYKLLPQTERMSTAVTVLNQHEGLEKPSKAAELEKRFEYNQEKVVEGEVYDADKDAKISCANTGKEASVGTCKSCKDREGCPSWA
jgi:recombination protein RecT